ncbi:MAG: hypothetical protein KJN77_02965 [Gammaproteobacteria bacterium]|nr:hypothetical protein [Gammaproteobacteria bacterium]
MAGLRETARLEAAMVAESEVRTVSRRYLGWLDVGVLLITLLVFLVFLLILNNLVFPQGARLGDIAARDGSGQTTSGGRGDVSVIGDGVDGFGQFIARLADVRRDVRIRPADSVAWTNAREGESVRNRDALQTFANSRARIDFTTDNHLQIGQNSLVIFSNNTADPFLQRRDPAVVVLQGELGGIVNEGYGAFAVQLPSGVALLSADPETRETANFKLTVNPDKSSTIAMYAGTAAIDIDGRKYSLGRNQALTITEDGRTAGVRNVPGRPRVTSPGRDRVAKFRELPPRVNFEWGRVTRAQNYRLELARDANFEEIIVDEYLNDTSFVHGNLAAGNYFWRVSARNGWVQGPVTKPRRLRVVQDLEAPSLELSPIQQAATGDYELRGRTSPDAKVYVRGQLVETSADGTFKHVFKVAPGAQTIVVEAIDSVGNIAINSQIFYGNIVASRSD